MVLEGGCKMNASPEQYSPEQLEAMQKPIARKPHSFVNSLINSGEVQNNKRLKKGISYILFLNNHLNQETFLQLQNHYDQLILIFKSKEELLKFNDMAIPKRSQIFCHLFENDLNASFEFAIKQVEYSHALITLFHEEKVSTLPIANHTLSRDMIYLIGSEWLYPTHAIQNIYLEYPLDSFIKSYINERCSEYRGVSQCKIGVSNLTQNRKTNIETVAEAYQALKTIQAIYSESLLTDVTYHFEANNLIVKLKAFMETQSSEVNARLMIYIREHIQPFNYHLLNKGHAKTLVVAYCFPPFIDTSGNVMAKRIRDQEEIVDIISNNMSRIRDKDFMLNTLAEHLVDTHYLLDVKQAFSSWESISGFIEEGLKVLEENPKSYEHLYSRAMFPQSHFLGYEIKVNHPHIFWRAEFSDPLHTTVTSDLRYAPIEDEQYITRIKKSLRPELVPLVDDNVFNVCELLALSHADELIFTNENQMEYMIERFDDNIKDSIRNRAVISRHPIPRKDDYYKVMTTYEVDTEYINLGYFGNFYATRGFNEIELVCKYLESKGETNFRIHCFTNIRGNVLNMYKNSDFKEYIILHPLVGYFEFLNITLLFDGLLIFDAHTIGIKQLNPYIPSKLSDYKGSGNMVWAFTEEGSVMDQDQSIIKTRMGDFEDYVNSFREIKANARNNSHLNQVIT